MMDRYLAIGLAVALSALVSTGAVLIERKFFPRPVVVGTVEMRSMVDEFVKQAVESKLPPEELEKRVSAYAEGLNEAARLLGDKHRVLILPAEAVLSGGVDLTPDLRALLGAQEAK